ncbi:MAG: undecaprenyl-diphosphatase, partial [Chloroflexota bacterium]|nr:undecaprenyl-diphosphatase [Chloroflexota bacterium]
MSIAQALWLALLQGFSELFPISSLGHTVLVPSLLGWSIDQRSETFLPFLVMLHLGTATALLI